jgi:hypothetical protein
MNLDPKRSKPGLKSRSAGIRFGSVRTTFRAALRGESDPKPLAMQLNQVKPAGDAFRRQLSCIALDGFDSEHQGNVIRYLPAPVPLWASGSRWLVTFLQAQKPDRLLERAGGGMSAPWGTVVRKRPHGPKPVLTATDIARLSIFLALPSLRERDQYHSSGNYSESCTPRLEAIISPSSKTAI